MLKIIILFFVLFAASRAYLRFKDKSLNARALAFWMILWTIILVFVLHPQFSDNFASFLGVQRGVDIAFLTAVVILFYLVFRLYIKVDSVDQNLTKLNANISKWMHKNNIDNKK